MVHSFYESIEHSLVSVLKGDAIIMIAKANFLNPYFLNGCMIEVKEHHHIAGLDALLFGFTYVHGAILHGHYNFLI